MPPVALLASRWERMRRVVIGTGFTVPPIDSPFPDLRYWLPSTTPHDELRRDEEIILGRVNDLLARDGLTELDALSGLYADVDQSFLLTFRELDHYPQRQESKYWGTWSLSGGCKPGWPAGQHRVFAYLKPPAANWKLEYLLTFLKESGFPAIVHVAGGDPCWSERFQTRQLRIASTPVDIAHAAQNCDVAMLNGNAGSVAALLLAGIPQVNMPLFVEQLVLSRRVVDFGAGLCANPADPQQFCACFMEVLHNCRYSDAARDFSRRYAEFDPQQTIDEIVLRIEQLLAGQDAGGQS